LDPSLSKPGRFDRLVYLVLAESKEIRANILVAQIMRKFKFEANSTPHSIALKVIDSIPLTLTGADLSAVASGALINEGIGTTL
jgi:peroxin-6